MRNPLSAIVHSADTIVASITEFETSARDCVDLQKLIDSNMESAQVIALCAQHQGRIINDVLTLSKLDSGMLQVTPHPIQPIEVLRSSLKMFEAELVSHDIVLSVIVEESYKKCGIRWVLADPSRLTQVGFPSPSKSKSLNSLPRSSQI